MIKNKIKLIRQAFRENCTYCEMMFEPAYTRQFASYLGYIENCEDEKTINI